MNDQRSLRIVDLAGTAILFLIFFQLLSDFVESIYAFALINTGIPLQILAVLFFLSPLLIWIFPALFSRHLLLSIGWFMLLCRIVEPLLDTGGRLLAAGIGVSCFMVLFTGLIRDRGRRREAGAALTMGTALAFSIMLSVLFRSLYSSVDITTREYYQVIGWILALMAGISLPKVLLPSRDNSDWGAVNLGNQQAQRGRVILLTLGLSAIFTLLYFSISAPNIISRWTGANFVFVIGACLSTLTLVIWILANRLRLLSRFNRPVIIIVNLIFTLSLGLTIWLHQSYFPSASSSYPIPEVDVGFWHWLALTVTLLLFPVIVIDFVLLVREVVRLQPSMRLLGGGFSISSVFMLAAIFAHIFTTTYDYIPVIGPAFRDRFWLVYLTIALVITLSLLAATRERKGDLQGLRGKNGGPFFPAAALLLAIIATTAVIMRSPHPSEDLESSKIRLLTYNIQQGYDLDGSRSFDNQLALIREIDPDIIGLQESDTSRIAGGNADVVRYFADNLDMYSYYGPKTVDGTFGIALLSRYPIVEPKTAYLFSEGEQVGAIEASITAGGQTFSIFVTHLGNSGPLIQQEQFLSLIMDRPNLIAMGDFNFKMDSEQYELTTSTLDDSWWLQWPEGADANGRYPDEKIDHIFVSPGIGIIGAQFIEDPASDHPAVTADIGW